ncbi:hypothetical protein A3A37_01200 [Candidatus Kaiserbacteria bacterium RIFCSPLOWO2_01_FULL_52_36]|nr:MAG: hypothetical protein A3A37_01200 [Candidatus Kaiserbacteria bacterium RIFCSPLOWO2_01_FULL_52_36]
MIEIIPTCVPMRDIDVAVCVSSIRGFSSKIHIDIDDGVFAPVFTWPYTKPGKWGEFILPEMDGMESEIHLMVANSREVGIQFARSGAKRVIGHVETFDTPEDVQRTFDAWLENGAQEVGLGILLATPLESLRSFILSCDVVHMMSIATIGTQGIAYDKSAPTRIAELHAQYPDLLISVDGGVAESNIADLVHAGARRFGVGSALTKSDDPAAAYNRLKILAESAIL